MQWILVFTNAVQVALTVFVFIAKVRIQMLLSNPLNWLDSICNVLNVFYMFICTVRNLMFAFLTFINGESASVCPATQDI